MGASRAHAQRGVALVAVLWIVAALVMLVAGVSGSIRGDVRAAASLRDQVALRALADGAILLALRDLASGAAQAELPASVSVVLADTPVLVRVASASGWLDLNHAPQENIEALLEKIGGLEVAEARAIAARIVDWRDPDEVVTPDGAEDERYDASGSPYRTRGEPFSVPEDLLQVLGVSFEVFDRIRDFVTTEGTGVLDPASAPPLLLDALGLDSAQPNGGLRAAGVPSGFLGMLGGMRVEARIDVGDGRQFVRVAWLRVHGNGPAGGARVEVLRTEFPHFLAGSN